MIVHTSLSKSDVEILQDHCEKYNITVSALIKILVTDFLDTNDKERINYISNEAKKVKPGRPRIYY